MTYASAPPNFSDELEAARAEIQQRSVPPIAPAMPTAVGFPAMPGGGALPTAVGFGAMPPAEESVPVPERSRPQGGFFGEDDSGATEIYRESKVDPMETTAPLPALASAPPPRAHAPTDAMFAPAASPPRNRSQPAQSELAPDARAIRVETAEAFEPHAKAFVADQELVWRPGMTGMNHSVAPALSGIAEDGAASAATAKRASRPDAPRQRSMAFTDNEFWDPQRPVSQTLADTDALIAHLQKPKARISLPLAIGGALLFALLAIVILAVVLW